MTDVDALLSHCQWLADAVGLGLAWVHGCSAPHVTPPRDQRAEVPLPGLGRRRPAAGHAARAQRPRSVPATTCTQWTSGATATPNGRRGTASRRCLVTCSASLTRCSFRWSL